MLIRVECFNHVIHIEFAKQITEYEDVEQLEQAPENVPHPMAVYPEEPTDPVSARLYF